MVSLLTLTLWWTLTHPPEQKTLLNQINRLEKQNSELLNRLQAPDLRTFQALQNFSTPSFPNSEYIPRDDESEAKYYKDLTGIGDVNIIDDTEVKMYSIKDFELDMELP